MVTKGYGFTIDDIDWSCPADLEPYAKAHDLELREADSLMHEMGLYNKLAFEVIMSHFSAGLAGKKSDAKYIEKPLISKMEEEKEKQSTNKESNEEIAVFEMKQRIKILRQSGLPESPI